MTRPNGPAAVATPPTGIPITPAAPPVTTWLTTDGVAERAQRARSTVNLAAVRGELHGHQSTRNGRPIRKGKWLFHTAAADAWIQGQDTRAQAIACGCSTAGRRRAAR